MASPSRPKTSASERTIVVFPVPPFCERTAIVADIGGTICGRWPPPPPSTVDLLSQRLRNSTLGFRTRPGGEGGSSGRRILSRSLLPVARPLGEDAVPGRSQIALPFAPRRGPHAASAPQLLLARAAVAAVG